MASRHLDPLVASPSIRPVGVRTLNRRARRTEMAVALAVVVLPFLGAVVALSLVITRGIHSWELALLVTMHFLGMVGISIGLHRYFSHRSFQTSKPVRLVLMALGSMTAMGPVFYWVANHRRHHSNTDQPGDPHSPHSPHDASAEGLIERLGAIWHAHLGWVFDFQVAELGRFIPDLLHDPILVRANRQYFTWLLLGLAIPAAIGGVVTSTWNGVWLGLIWGGLLRIFLGQQSVAFINSVCHIWGSRPFRGLGGGESRNNVVVAILTLGEGWHNNHHAFPYAAVFGLKWWQFDPLGWLLRALAWFGIVWDLKRPTKSLINEALKKGTAMPSDRYLPETAELGGSHS